MKDIQSRSKLIQVKFYVGPLYTIYRSRIHVYIS